MNGNTPRPEEIEDAAAEVHTLVRQAADHASIGDWRRAYTAAEQAQGAARRLKELIGARRETVQRLRTSISGTVPRP